MVARLLIGLVVVYQKTLSPFTPAACRYTPTCSQYAKEALQKYGAMRGSWLATRRLLRCHPWGGHGPDPVP
ncbi:MAG: membrane protein insertion efficiency factor YidD [Gemmatimonadota bacterium]